MISAQRINSFIPQNSAPSAPLRVNVSLPLFQRVTNNQDFLGLPLPKDVDGGVVYEETKLNPLNNASTLNQFNSVYPCIPQPINHRQLRPSPIDDSIGFQPSYGYARNQPRGIASIPQRDALFAYKPPLNMSTNKELAPMMPLSKF